MHLQRVQVPDFRVLKDVDITFEKDFNPRVFPLGSQNGGGKSTLLQLIFVLLHCSTHPDRLPALKNLLNGFSLREGEDKRVLAIIDIWDGEKIVQFNFFACGETYINNMMIADGIINEQPEEKKIKLSNLETLQNIRLKISRFAQDKIELQEITNELSSTRSKEIPNHLQIRLSNLGFTSIVYDPDPITRMFSFDKTRTNLELQLSQIHQKLYEQADELSEEVEKATTYLQSNNIEYILKYRGRGYSSHLRIKTQDIFILCHVNHIDIDKAKKFLNDVSNKIFLTAPSTQIFIFLPKKAQKSLFKKQENTTFDNSYSHHFNDFKSSLSGLFTYDFLAVNLIIELFKSARDIDFKKAIETGEYGNSYKNLLNEFSSLLVNKSININKDLSGVTFSVNNSNNKVELYPEDLSHGELKRLSIYCWLKYNNIQDAIVLMDEVDLALHPDWQYQLVSELVEWSPTNQYILATHSYELCQALTPSHVKVLEPKLTERRSD
jgi:predicted ATP-dependent endonuclease of OLD family